MRGFEQTKKEKSRGKTVNHVNPLLYYTDYGASWAFLWAELYKNGPNYIKMLATKTGKNAHEAPYDMHY